MNIPKPKNLKLWHIVLPLLVLANLAYLTHNVFGWIVTLAFFLYAPGYLLFRSLADPKALSFGRISISVGLSLLLITITGLILNTLHFIFLERPLQTLYIFIALDIMVVILLRLNRAIAFNWTARVPHLKFEEWIFGVLITLIPILSILGAIRLNNGASNILTMIMIVLIGLLFPALMIRPNMPRIYPYAVFMTALAILLANSLRGWSITGHDIHHEFSVFSSVMKLGYWSPGSDPGDPYYSCLSITIVPTILAKITGISAVFIYKIVFQIIFATIIPAVYLFARKFVADKQALLGAFALVTFPTFINDFPFLNRQEVAFGYFILIIFVNFTNMAARAKSILTVLLLLGVILSHYSSSYVTVSILLLTLIVYRLLTRIYKIITPLNIPILSLPIIIMAFLATFVWNMQITASSGNLSSTLTSSVKGLLGQDEAKVNGNSIVPNAKKISPAEQLAVSSSKIRAVTAYSPAELAPLTNLGKAIDKKTNVISLNSLLHSTIAILLQLLVALGTVVLFLSYFRKKLKTKDVYILASGISFLFALMLFTFVPQLSIGYDVTRLFQQSLTVLWLPVTFLLTTLFVGFKKFKLMASACVITFIYFFLSGLVPQLTGGYLPNLVLNNSGLYYNYFYTHKSDELGTAWLRDPANGRLKYMTVFMDINSASPPLGFPVAIGLTNGKFQGYYYTDYANGSTGRYRALFSSGFIEYTSPAFTEGKNRIYTNDKSTINFTWPTQ